MAKELREVMHFICERCDHVWIPKDPAVEPQNCPGCKSPYWNKPRQQKAAKAAKTRKRK